MIENSGFPNYPLVSICIPTYNDGHYLQKSLRSISRQTYKNIEIIILDNASTDDTKQIVQSFTDPRISYHRNATNIGTFQNMNRIIGLARGDILAIYHSDDIYDPTIVEKQAGFLLTHPDAGAVFCLDRYIDENDRVFGETKLPCELKNKTCLSFAEVFVTLLRYKNIFIRCPTFMTRAEVFKRVGLFKVEYFDSAADVDMWLSILRHYKVAILNEVLMSYRAGGSQWFTSYNYLRTEPDNFFVVMDHYLKTVEAIQGLSGVLDTYEFHRCDDETFRAINCVIRQEVQRAKELLSLGKKGRWRKLGRRFGRRRLRVLALRTMMRVGIKLRVIEYLARILHWIEYRGRIIPYPHGSG